MVRASHDVIAGCLLLICAVQSAVASPAVPVQFGAADLAPGTSVHATLLVFDERSGQWKVVRSEPVRPGESGVILTGEAGQRSFVAFEDSTGMQIVDGPFYWPFHSVARPVGGERFRSVRVVWSGPPAASPRWLAPDADTTMGAMPVCAAWTPAEFECFGVKPDESGVILASMEGLLEYGVVEPADTQPLVRRVASIRAAWGRLILFTNPMGRVMTGPESVALYRPVRAELLARAGLLGEAVMDGMAVTRIGATAWWLAGPVPPDDAVLKFSGEGLAPGRVRLAECCAGPPELHAAVPVEPATLITVRVTGAGGRRVPGALVTLFEISEVPTAVDDVRRLRTALVETWTDERGECAVPLARDRPYEVLAVHAALGRATARLRPADRQVTLRLSSSRQVRGRVLRQGTGAAGVAVRIAPALEALPDGSDPLGAFGLDGLTDERGRFVLAIPPHRAGDVMIGDPLVGQARLPLPAASSGDIVDLGDIELEPALLLDVRVEGPPGCDLLAAGPVGSSGLTMVAGARLSESLAESRYHLTVPEPGQWWLSLRCGNSSVPLDQPTVDVEALPYTQHVERRVLPWE